jgi:hypothetical protein
MTSDIPTKKTVKAMDELLREKRQQMPSMSAMVHFERIFPRRLMAEWPVRGAGREGA